jgi:hypothetical protein
MAYKERRKREEDKEGQQQRADFSRREGGCSKNFDSAPSALARKQPALRAVFRTQPAPFGAGQNTETQNTEHTS